MSDDASSLRRYVDDRDEAAFSEVVRRNMNPVYSVALRCAGGDRHLAEDIVQQVFVALARDARRLSSHPALIGWLYITTRHVSASIVRKEQRRKRREQEAHTMNEILPNEQTESEWSQLAPVLESAMDDLSDEDRLAVLLRFYGGRSYADVGAALRLSEEAARKRVDRSLDKLRITLGRRGVVSSATALGGLLAHHAVGAAPVGLSSTVAAAAVTGTGLTVGTWTILSMTKLQTGIVAALLLGGTTGLILQQRMSSDLRSSHLAGREPSAQPAIDQRPPPEPQKTTQAVVVVSEPLTAMATPAAAESEAMLQRKAQMRRRYEPFFAQRGLTPQQGERFIELKLQQFEVNEDVQAAVRQGGMAGDSVGVAALRAQHSAPIIREMKEILGAEGYVAYGAYEHRSFYQAAFVGPIDAALTPARAGLSPEQSDVLAAIIAANDHPIRPDPSSISTRVNIDWEKVLAQSATVLTPVQQSLFQGYVEREKARKR